MEPDQSTLQLAYAVSVVTSIALCGILWRHREKTGAIPLLCYVGSGLLWGATQLANVTIVDPAVSTALVRFLYVVIAFGTATLFVFALEYTGRERYLGPGTYLVLSIHPLFVAVAAVADPGGFFFAAFAADPASTVGVSATYGTGLVLHMVYTYVLVGASVLLFVDVLYHSRSLYRMQGLALVGGAVLPTVPPALLFVGVLAFDAAPLVFPIASGLLTIAILRYRLIDILPIARDRVVDTINDGVFVVDTDDRLVDVNPQGRRFLATIGIDDEALVGRPFPSLLPNTELRDRYEAVTERETETSFEVAVGLRHVRLTVTPIDDGRDRHVGWLVVTHDVTDRNRREKRLERQNERLEEFASIVSHDLRNPLAVADGYRELARESDDPDEYLERIARAHDRMETIIDDVLTLAREGADVTDPEEVDLGRLAERAWEGVDTGDATLEVHSRTPIRADPARLRRLLENLFRNAVEHGSGSSLQVGVGVTDVDFGSGVLVYVEDDGPGIPPNQRDRIFEAGYSTAEEGTGFGLSIVKRIAEAHGWSVAVTDGERGGVRFEFTGVERAGAAASAVPLE